MKTIDRLLDIGPVELKEIAANGAVIWRGARSPHDRIDDLPQAAQDAIMAHWTPERVAAWEALVAKTPEETAANEAATVEQARIATFKADVIRQQLITQLVTATPVQINTYVDNQVNDLVGAKLLLKRILLVLATVVRE